MASEGSASFGSCGSIPSAVRRAVNFAGPSASSTFTAGMLSDFASASRIVTVP